MSWTSGGIGAPGRDDDAEYRAMHLELLKQQEEAERVLIMKQKKKEQQILQRQRRRKEQQAIRQEQQQQQQQRLANNPSAPLPITPVPPYQYQLPESLAAAGMLPLLPQAAAAAAGTVKVKQRRKTKSEPRVKKGQGLPQPVTASDGSSLGGSTESMLRIKKEESGSEDEDVDVEKKWADSLVDRTATLLELSRFQCEYASDEDAIEADYYEPLA